jgi:DNA-binding transcriptional ArsR family regulator
VTAGSGRGGLAELADLEAVFAALAHASRRHVLVVIHARGRMTAGEIADRFHHAWPTTSRHLKVLERAGLVRAERRGRERVYTVGVRRLTSVVGDWLSWFGRGARAPRG